MRGTLGRPFEEPVPNRFILAYAGNTISRFIAPNQPSVHPRVCGEHCARTALSSAAVGSSPRMRGTPRAGRSAEHHPRFIPAYAGNTFEGAIPSILASVHPRVCGEHIRFSGILIVACGSSPRMRGTQTFRSLDCVEERFIPRMRGTRRSVQDSAETLRFIPAYAGNTLKVDSAAAVRVQTHVGLGVGVVAAVSGSSPRMRGTHQTLLYSRPDDRFIPAYAGNTAHGLTA